MSLITQLVIRCVGAGPQTKWVLPIVFFPELGASSWLSCYFVVCSETMLMLAAVLCLRCR